MICSKPGCPLHTQEDPPTVTAIRATACGHVLSYGTHPDMVERLKFNLAVLLKLGDDRFELAEMSDDDMAEAFVHGLNCDRCVITADKDAITEAVQALAIEGR